MAFLVATTSVPSVYRPNDDCWNAARSCQQQQCEQELLQQKNLNIIVIILVISFPVILRFPCALSETASSQKSPSSGLSFCALNTFLTSSSLSFFSMFCKKFIPLLFNMYLSGIAPVSRGLL